VSVRGADYQANNIYSKYTDGVLLWIISRWRITVDHIRDQSCERNVLFPCTPRFSHSGMYIFCLSQFGFVKDYLLMARALPRITLVAGDAGFCRSVGICEVC